MCKVSWRKTLLWFKPVSVPVVLEVSGMVEAEVFPKCCVTDEMEYCLTALGDEDCMKSQVIAG